MYSNTDRNQIFIGSETEQYMLVLVTNRLQITTYSSVLIGRHITYIHKTP